MGFNSGFKVLKVGRFYKLCCLTDLWARPCETMACILLYLQLFSILQF